jgi:hypothetical protein
MHCVMVIALRFLTARYFRSECGIESTNIPNVFIRSDDAVDPITKQQGGRGLHQPEQPACISRTQKRIRYRISD